MTSRAEEQPYLHELSGDLDWDDSDDPPLGGFDALLLLAAGTAYYGAVWLLSGLAPLPLLISRLKNWSWSGSGSGRRTPA